MPKTIPFNCEVCGKFICKDGYVSVVYDDWNGGEELSEAYCKKCYQIVRRGKEK